MNRTCLALAALMLAATSWAEEPQVVPHPLKSVSPDGPRGTLWVDFEIEEEGAGDDMTAVQSGFDAELNFVASSRLTLWIGLRRGNWEFNPVEGVTDKQEVMSFRAGLRFYLGHGGQ